MVQRYPAPESVPIEYFKLLPAKETKQLNDKKPSFNPAERIDVDYWVELGYIFPTLVWLLFHTVCYDIKKQITDKEGEMKVFLDSLLIRWILTGETVKIVKLH